MRPPSFLIEKVLGAAHFRIVGAEPHESTDSAMKRAQEIYSACLQNADLHVSNERLRASVAELEQRDLQWERTSDITASSTARAKEILGAGNYDNVDHAAQRVVDERDELRSVLKKHEALMPRALAADALGYVITADMIREWRKVLYKVRSGPVAAPKPDVDNGGGWKPDASELDACLETIVGSAIRWQVALLRRVLDDHAKRGVVIDGEKWVRLNLTMPALSNVNAEAADMLARSKCQVDVFDTGRLRDAVAKVPALEQV